MIYKGIWQWPRYVWSEQVIEEYSDGTQKVSYPGRKRLLLLEIILALISAVFGVIPYLYFGSAALMLTVIIVTPILSIFAFYILSFTVKEYKIDERTGDKVVTERPSDAHFMDVQEEEQVFEMVKDIKDTKRKVLGKDDEGNFISILDNPFTNSNMAIVGYPGSGKSACLVNTHIFQCIRAGKSFVITDSKGAVYEQTAGLAEKMGYKLRVLNLKPKEMKHSDGVEMMKTITDQMGGETMANIIMANAAGGGEKQDFWYKCEFNLLKALILYVKFEPEIEEEDKNLITVHKLLIDNTVEQITDLLLNISNPNHPAYAAAQGFAKSRDQVRESAYGGLSVKLSLLAQPAVKEILTHDEIDLREPLTTKCAYYVIISDTDTSAKFLACLFFSTLFNELIDESDSRYHQHPPVDVEFILDEFKATGSIPNFDNILSVARSRHLNIEFIVQDITQLQEMYPEGWHTIMNDCQSWLLIATREPTNLDYFASLFGERYIIKESESYGINGNAITQNAVDRRVSESYQKEKLLPSWQIFLMSRKKLLLSYAGEPPIILNKYMYWHHPAYKIIQDQHLERNCKDHIPAWRQALINAGKDIMDTYVPESARKSPAMLMKEAEKAQKESSKKESEAKEDKSSYKAPASKKKGQVKNDWQKKKEEEIKKNVYESIMKTI